MLRFYNYAYFVAICIGLALRVSNSQHLVVTLVVMGACMLLIFAYKSASFFLDGQNL